MVRLSKEIIPPSTAAKHSQHDIIKIVIKRCFKLTCFAVAVFVIYKQVCDYLRNEDVSVISYRKYNEDICDKYPTFTICLNPTIDDLLYYSNILYREEKLNEVLKISGPNYYEMLIGTDFKGNGVTNFSLLEFDDAKYNLFSMVVQYWAYSHKEEPLVYWERDSDVNLNSLFHQGYQDPGCLCFTRSEMSYPSKRVHKENIILNSLNWNGDLFIYLQYPGQFVNVMEGDEQVNIKLSGTGSEGRRLKFEVTQLQVLRKRYDGKVACDMDLDSNIDVRWRESVMKLVGCIPTYWKGFAHSSKFQLLQLKDCTTSGQYQSFTNWYTYKTDPNITYEPSCTWPTIIKNIEHKEDNRSLLMIEIHHESGYYVNVQNTKAFTFNVLWSQVGGLVGIFLGYSILQFPELIKGIISFLKHIFHI